MPPLGGGAVKYPEADRGTYKTDPTLLHVK